MPQRVYVTGHGFVEFPDDAKQDQIHAALLRDVPPPDPTIGETAKSAFGAFAQGGAGVLGSIPKAVGVGLGAITGTEPEQTLPYQFGQGAEDMVESAFPEDPRLKGKSFLWSTLPQAVGSTAGFAATGVGGQLLAPARIAKAAGTAITASTGAVAGGVEGYEDAKRSGADQDSAFASFLLNAGVGTSEALPLGRILNRINVDTKGALQTIVEAGKSAAEEGSQETLQTLASNLVAQNLYDEDRQLMESVLEGGAAGAATGFLMTVLGKGARKALGIQGTEPQPEKAIVDVDLSYKGADWQGPPPPPNPSTQAPQPETVTVTRTLLEQVQDALQANQVTAEKPRVRVPPEPDLNEEAVAKVSAELATHDWDQLSGRAVDLISVERGLWTPDQRVEAEALIGSKAIKDGNIDLWRVLRTRTLNEDRHSQGQKPIDHMAAGLTPDQIRLARGDRAEVPTAVETKQHRNAMGVSERQTTEGLRSAVETSTDDSPVDQAILDAAVEREMATGQPFQARKTAETPQATASLKQPIIQTATDNVKDNASNVIGNASAKNPAPVSTPKPKQNEDSFTVPPVATTVQRPSETITGLDEREGSAMPAEGKAETLPPRAAPSSRRRTKAVRENPDLIDIIESTIGSLRVFVARSANRAQRFQEMYDSGDYHDFVRTAYGRRLVSTQGKHSPDQVVQALISNGDVRPDFGVEDLWRALMNAVRERREGKVAGAAKQSPLDKEAAANADFNRRAIRKTDKAGNVVPAGSLTVGDKFTVDGTNFVVADLETGQDGELDQVVVEDGRRFGTQRFAGNLYLKPDPASFTAAAGTEPDDNVPFAMQAKPSGGMSKADVQGVVDRLATAMPGATPTVVVQRVEDLPQPLRRGGGAQGVFWRGRTYLVADNLSDAEEASRKWIHEQVGHFGLRAVLGNELKPMLEAVLRAYDGSAELRRIASTYGLDMTDAADRVEAAEELLAHMAENASGNPGLWRSVVAAIKKAWRKLTGGEISDDEVKALITRAVRHVASARLKREQGDKNFESGGRFALDGGMNPTDQSDPNAERQNLNSAYMSAVESGDMKKAQRILDDAAKVAGLRPVSVRYYAPSTPLLDTSKQKGATVTVWRKGAPPEGGRSYNHADRFLEAGVSAYWHPEAISFAGMDDRPWYKIKGTLVGYGSDGEPLVDVIDSHKATKKELKDYKTPKLDLQVGDIVSLPRYASYSDAFIVTGHTAWGYHIRAWLELPIDAPLPPHLRFGPESLAHDEQDVIVWGGSVSREVVVVDAAGRTLTPSERFPVQESEKPPPRFSLKDQDREYLAAVERGDLETAQRMVDEAASKAGFTTVAWRGDKIEIETFDPDWRAQNLTSAIGFSFSSDKATAEVYGTPRKYFLKGKQWRLNYTEDQGVPDEPWYRRYSEEKLSELLGLDGIDVSDSEELSNFWKSLKATVIRIDNIDDSDLISSTGENPATLFIVKEPNQIKSASPITRDRQGNVIPLSQRFSSSDDIRFALKPEDYKSKHDALTARIVAAKSSGNAKDAKAARDEMAQLENAQFGFQAAKSDDDARASQPSTPAPSSGERLAPEQARRAILDVQGATTNPTQSVDTWWEQFKKWARKFATALPELPTSGEGVAKFAAVRRWHRAVSAETDLARKKAERRVKAIIAPIQRLGRKDIDPNTLAKYESLTNKIQAERAKGAKANAERIDKWNDMRDALMPQLNANPWFIFRNVILWRDLAYRVGHLKTDDGGPITPPAGLSLEDVIAQASEARLAVEKSPHREAIEDSLARHYAFVESMQKELEDHGEIIPEEMKNPDYFPHHILEGWTGRLAPVRATTDGPWRPYMMPITGTRKLHQSDYLAAMYKHAADVLANNAQVDLVERDVKPYDISKQHEEDLTERFGADLAKKLLYDQRHLPPGYTVIRPSERLKLAAAYVIDRATLSARIGQALTDADLLEQIRSMGGTVNITAEDIRDALTVGEQVRWIVPVEVADALEGIAKREQAEANPTFGASLMKPLAKTQQLWKWNILFNPLNWVRYEYGNTMTDAIDKVFGLDPTVSKYLKRSLTEIRQGAAGNPTLEYDAALKEGVFQTVTAAEADEIQTLKGFREFMSDSDKAKDTWGRFWRMTTGLSAVRESTFRYAKFLADLERMENGERPVYGGAHHAEVDAQLNNYQKAGLISRKTFGDYNDISVAGAFLRKYVFPFWSWSEVNMKYHVNLARNMVDMVKLGDILAAKNAGRALAVNTTVAAVGIGLRLILVRAAVEAWNQFGGAAAGLWEPDDDLESQLSEMDRRRLHLILGKDENGKVRVIYLPNALSDVMEWVGGNNFVRLAGDWIQGDISFARFAKDFAKQAPGDFLNKAVQGVRPEAKFAYTMTSGKDPFPDVLNQRGVDRADWYWMLGQAVDRDVAVALRSQLDPYFYSPESAGDWWQRKILQVRRRDPEQWAYYEVREMASDWKEEKTGKRFEAWHYNSPDQKVVRNFRRAIYNADMENAQKFYTAALELGYTKDRFKASLRAQDPLSDISKDQRQEFEAGLNPYEKRMLGLAQRYYSRISTGKGKEADLFPKKPGAVFTPRPDRLREMMGAGR